MGHGEGYQYSHDFPDHFVPQDYLGDARRYYEPTEQGVEKENQGTRREMAGARAGEGGSPEGSDGRGMTVMTFARYPDWDHTDFARGILEHESFSSLPLHIMTDHEFRELLNHSLEHKRVLERRKEGITFHIRLR